MPEPPFSDDSPPRPPAAEASAGPLRVLADTAQALAASVGLAPQVDLFMDEKYARWAEHYPEPILDFGAGTGFFAHQLASRGLSVTAADVVDRCRFPEVELQLFEPPRLPFADGAFGTSVAHFVFHHIEDQDAAFRELVRVTRHTIVISEDVVDGALDEAFAAMHTGSSPWNRAWDSFRSTEDWRRFFRRFPTELVGQLTIPRYRTPFYPVRRVVFVLALPADALPAEGS